MIVLRPLIIERGNEVPIPNEPVLIWKGVT